MRLLVLPLLVSLAVGGFSQVAAESNEGVALPSAPQNTIPVPLKVYNENDRLFGRGWAIPIKGGFVTVRSLLAGAARVELVGAGEVAEPIAAIGGEDIEANLVLVRTENEVSSALTPSPAPAGVTPAFSVSCLTDSLKVEKLRVRDVPAFGVAWTGYAGQREAVLGCPAFGEGGIWQGVVAWESPFGKPSVAIVPATRVLPLLEADWKSWEEWRSAEAAAGVKLRRSLLSESIQDLWREDYRTAEATLSYLIENDYDNARAWYFRGYAKAMQGRRRDAIVDYEQAVSRQPDHAEMRFSLGLSYALLLNTPKAQEQLVALEKLDAGLAHRLSVIVVSLDDSGHKHDDEESHSDKASHRDGPAEDGANLHAPVAPGTVTKPATPPPAGPRL